MKRTLSALLALSLMAAPVWACLNSRDSDTDSLTNEARKLPELARVLTGRFERNPPLFYQLRIARETKELAANPKNFGLYDDIAVGYDRLGDDDAALTWIEKKRKLLPAYPAEKEAWYRYFANVGTFRIHRWLHNGAKPESLREAFQARAEIARAIEIKPDAHFGRERYQLMAMEWILTDRKQSFAQYLAAHKTAVDTEEKTITGLAGLIVLGAAWESVDVTDALVAQIKAGNLAYFADLRYQELRKAGKKSLAQLPGDARTDFERNGHTGRQHDDNALPAPSDTDLIEKKYKALRAEADQWHQRRTEYMVARLKQGKHPDTDPTFWKEWKEGTPPGLDFSILETVPRKVTGALTGFLLVAVLFSPLWIPIVVVVALVVTLSRRAKRRDTVGR